MISILTQKVFSKQSFWPYMLSHRNSQKWLFNGCLIYYLYSRLRANMYITCNRWYPYSDGTQIVHPHKRVSIKCILSGVIRPMASKNKHQCYRKKFKITHHRYFKLRKFRKLRKVFILEKKISLKFPHSCLKE